MNFMVISLLVVCMVTMETALGAKILVVAPDHYSHANSMAVAGGALVEAGHEVHFLSVPRHRKLAERNGLKGIYFQATNYTHPEANDEFVWKMIDARTMRKLIVLINEVTDVMAGLCHQMLEDESLYDQIAEAGYDLALVDSIDPIRCLLVIPYRHGIPYVTLGMRHDPWNARVPASPSAEGHCGIQPFADPYNPTMWERWRAFLMSVAFYVMLPPSQMSDNFISKYAPNKPQISMRELYQNAELHFMIMEASCLDTPRAAAPHLIYLKSLGSETPISMTAEFQEFADAAQDGLIVMSFGSGVKMIPMSQMEKMMAAFKQIPERVVMRYDGPLPPELPDNVKLSKWLPQNDLLAHPNTRLFITHAGANGQTEALYHGVPFVSLPLMAEQMYNAARGVARGFGTQLDFHTFTSHDLLTSIRQVIDDPNYRGRIMNCSRKYRSMPNPQKTFTFWAEHVMKHGGDHLKPTYLKMPLWRWFDLDILFICFILIHSNIHIAKFIFKGIRMALRKCRGAKHKLQ